MSDKSRLEIFATLKASEFNGLDLSEKLGLAPTTISYHMNMLVREGFVSVSKRGTGIYYTLNTASLRRFVQELEHFLSVRPVAAPNESEAFQAKPAPAMDETARKEPAAEFTFCSRLFNI